MIDWSITVSVAPASEPVSTADAKIHLRETLSDASNDAHIDMLVKAARRHIETTNSIALITQTLVMKLDRFPAGDTPILLPRSPAGSITSVQYIDNQGDTQTWASGSYALDSSSRPARLHPVYNETYPSTRPIENAVTITYTAGYGTNASDVPVEIIHAIKLMVTLWYENRESHGLGRLNELPISVKSLLSDYKLRYNGPVERRPFNHVYW